MKERFLTINTVYIPKNEYWLIISDYNWWGKNYRMVKEWTSEALTNGVLEHEGMILKFKTSEDRTQFLLRWANG